MKKVRDSYLTCLMLLLGPLDSVNQQEAERDTWSLLPHPYRHGLAIEKLKQGKWIKTCIS